MLQSSGNNKHQYVANIGGKKFLLLCNFRLNLLLVLASFRSSLFCEVRALWLLSFLISEQVRVKSLVSIVSKDPFHLPRVENACHQKIWLGGHQAQSIAESRVELVLFLLSCFARVHLRAHEALELQAHNWIS